MRMFIFFAFANQAKLQMYSLSDTIFSFPSNYVLWTNQNFY